MQRKSISHPWRELMPIKMLTHEGQSNDPNKIALAIYFWQWRIWTRIFGKPCRHQHLKGRQCSEQIHSSPKQRRQKPNNISSESGVFPLLLKNSFDEIWCFFHRISSNKFHQKLYVGKKGNTVSLDFYLAIVCTTLVRNLFVQIHVDACVVFKQYGFKYLR